MKSRTILTCIWLAGLTICLLVLESYCHTRNEEGTPYLLDDDRLSVMQPVIILFSSYLAGVLGFWFVRPFKPPRTDMAERTRFWLALFCTVFFNLVVIFFVAYVHVVGGEKTVQEYVDQGVTLAGYLSFLVAPVNLYYFGSKPAAIS